MESVRKFLVTQERLGTVGHAVFAAAVNMPTGTLAKHVRLEHTRGGAMEFVTLVRLDHGQRQGIITVPLTMMILRFQTENVLFIRRMVQRAWKSAAPAAIESTERRVYRRQMTITKKRVP